MANFKDHFSQQAADYARYRPAYPAALFDWLAQLSASHQVALDVATGNGQAAVALAEHFDQVHASDPSAQQLANAPAHAKINYHGEPAERSSLPDASVDLLTVAQALHWFDLPAFLKEAERLLKPAGVLAIWCYELCNCTAEIDALISHYYHDVVGPHWPPERRWVEHGYADLTLPYPRLIAPEFEMQLHWSLHDLLGYLGTWSATQAYQAAHGQDPRQQLLPALQQAWGEPSQQRKIRWPLKLHVCRKSDRLPGSE